MSFVEVGSPFSTRMQRDPEVMTVRGVLELADADPYEYDNDRRGSSYWMWRGLLRGDGWTATWHGPRPLTGPVELTGYFSSSLYLDPGHVRGRIARVRIISEAYRNGEVGEEEIVENAPSRYRDVTSAPQCHSKDRTAHADGTYYRDTATLIDLDLDDVPPETLRPRLVPGHISAADDDAVWVVDTELPVVSRIDTHADDAVEYVLPARAAERRWVTATPTGCWVCGAGGLYRITTGTGAYQIAEGSTFPAAISGETLLAHDGHHAWTLHNPDQPPQVLDLPTGRDDCVGIDRDTGDFVVALGTAGRPHWQLQLVRITTSGQVHPGPQITLTDGRGQRPFLAGAPLRWFYGGVVATVNSDLTLGPATRLPKSHVDGGSLGEHAWVVTYRSTVDPLRPWWPITEPADPASPLPMIPIFTILEPSTLTTQASWRIDKHRSVTTQPSTVWITDRDKLYRLPARPTYQQQPVDVAALITHSIAPKLKRSQQTNE